MAAIGVPGTPRLLRELNDRAALELLLVRGPLTRARLGELTGLSKVTASQLVERLEQRGLVTRVGEQAGGRGPNAQLYAVRPDSAHVVGVDVRAERVIAACADITGVVVGRSEHPTHGTADPVAVVHRAIAGAVAAAGITTADVRRTVLGTPGQIDPATGDLGYAEDLPGWHRELRTALCAALDAPVVLVNDVNLAAVAEADTGAAQGVDDFVLVWIGHGVGLAAVLGGRLHIGAAGAAGEIGYLPVPGAPVPAGPVPAGPVPVSRRSPQGAFQGLAGAEAVRAVGREHGFDAADAAGAVRAAVAAGPPGHPYLDEVARRLSLGVAAACAVLDPPLVVLAGAVGQAGGEAVTRRIAREVAAITLSAPRVEPSRVPVDPVLRGALRTALDAVRDEVFGSTTR